jgi:anti-anti-sigma factor
MTHERETAARESVIVVLRGELDVLGAAVAAAEVAAAVVGGHCVIVDLSRVSFLDCHALGALAAVRLAAQRAGGDVRLVNPRGTVLRLLTLLDMADLGLPD